MITEFPPGTRPEGRNFPIRNRIISGLAQATAVIEGDLKSGSLITARRAFQQDRVVYAMPGRVDEAGSEGPCMLLRNGAKLLLAADDILTDFEKVYSDKINIFKLLERSPVVVDKVLRSMSVYSKSERKPREAVAASRVPEPPAEAPPQTAPTPEEEAKLREQLAEIGGRAEELYRLLPPEGGISCDDVAEAGIPISEVMVLAAQMELYGLLEILPGGQMKRKKTQ